MKKNMRNRAMIGMVMMSLVVSAAIAQSPQQCQEATLETQMRGMWTDGVWTDPSTKMMWTAKDNAKDVSYKAAVNYCRDLRLAGHSDWRLATMAELQGIYDETAWTPGLSGDEVQDTWHVKGNLFLTGYQWAYGQNERIEGDQYFLDFNDGRSYSETILHSSVCMRALCVRGPETP